MLDESKQLAGMVMSPQEKQQGVQVRYGTVQSVSGSTANVIVDGDTSATTIPRACDTSANRRVIILCNGTVWTVLAEFK